MNEYGELLDDADRGKNRSTGKKKNVPVSLCPKIEPQVYRAMFSTALVQ